MGQSKNQDQLFLQAAKWLAFLVIIGQLIFTSNLFDTYSLVKVLQAYPHVLLPIQFVFYLWPIILIWLAASLFLSKFRQSYESFNDSFQLLIAPKLLEFFFYQLVFLVLWVNYAYLLAFIILMLYLRRMISAMKLISRKSSLNSPAWLLKYPLGLNLGWLFCMASYIFYTYLISKGLGSQNFWLIAVASMLLITTLVGVTYLFAFYGNPMIMPVILLFLIGLLMNHYPGSTFIYRNNAFYLTIALLFILGLAVYVRYLRYQIKQQSS